MSKENAKQFLDLVQEDQQLQKQFKNYGILTETVFYEKIHPLALEKGLDFTYQEFQQPVTGELHDDELDHVAGGNTTKDGYWWTSFVYSCGKWKPTSGVWIALQNQCGSCENWIRSTNGLFNKCIANKG